MTSVMPRKTARRLSNRWPRTWISSWSSVLRTARTPTASRKWRNAAQDRKNRMLPFRSWQCRRGGWIAQDREPNLSVKIVRQPKKIALIGAPSSAAAFSLGSEKALAALRAAGIVDRLQTAGYEVIDHGDRSEERRVGKECRSR